MAFGFIRTVGKGLGLGKSPLSHGDEAAEVASVASKVDLAEAVRRSRTESFVAEESLGERPELVATCVPTRSATQPSVTSSVMAGKDALYEPGTINPAFPFENSLFASQRMFNGPAQFDEVKPLITQDGPTACVTPPRTGGPIPLGL